MRGMLHDSPVVCIVSSPRFPVLFVCVSHFLVALLSLGRHSTRHAIASRGFPRSPPRARNERTVAQYVQVSVAHRGFIVSLVKTRRMEQLAGLTEVASRERRREDITVC